MKLFLEVTKDEYELPVAVAGSAAELARMLGVSTSCICHSINDEHKCKHKYIKVEIDDEEVPA